MPDVDRLVTFMQIMTTPMIIFVLTEPFVFTQRIYNDSLLVAGVQNNMKMTRH